MQFFLFILCGIFCIFIGVDFAGHKLFRQRRTVPQCFLLLFLLLSAAGSLTLGIISTVNTDSQNKTNDYLAYRYLTDGNTVMAQTKAQLAADDPNAEAVVPLADCVSGDYISAYFDSVRLLDEGTAGGTLKDSIQRVKQISAERLGLTSSETKSANIKPSEISTEAAEKKAQEQVKNEVDTCFKNLILDDRTREKDNNLYAVDSLLNSNDLSGISEQRIQALLSKYPNDSDILRLCVKYYIGEGDYARARSYAETLLNKESTPGNYVIYTDLIAEASQNGSGLAAAGDPEVKSLLDSADNYERQADAITPGGDSSLQEKQAELKNKADELRTQSKNVDVRRAINYLLAKEPLLGDNTGVFDVQLAKLYLAAGDRDTARAYIKKVVSHSGALDDKSAVKQALQKVTDAYNQSQGSDTDSLLGSSVHGLVSAQSQGVVPVTGTTVNGKFSDFMTSTLKYDRINVHIGKLDTTHYPAIKAYVNVSGEKQGQFGLASSFGKSDFNLIDTQYMIDNFNFVNNQNSNAAISIVLDCSGSMEGDSIQEAKTAAAGCIDKMDSGHQQLSVVAYNDTAHTVTDLTNSADKLKSGINSLQSYGGTDISAGIAAGIQTLSGAEGTKAIILLTDGQDNNTQDAMDKTVQKAINNNIAVYTVGFGDIREDYLSSIAKKTGGIFIKADNSVELSDIYLTLQKYIVNNYRFDYTVKENPDTDPRNLIVRIPQYQSSDQKDYSLHQASESDSGALPTGITPGDGNGVSVLSVSPNGVSVGQIKAGMQVTVNGSGFKAGANFSIGGIALSSVKVINGSTATGWLAGNFSAGSYDVDVTLPDKKTAVGCNVFYVFRAGSTKSVKLGSLLITADTIGQTADDQFVANGNVMINNFLRSSGALTITANNLPEKFDINASQTANLGDSGAVSGKGKIYVSYSQANPVSKSFASLIMDGKDLIVRNGSFKVGVDGESNSFDSTLMDKNFNLPGLGEVKVADLKLYSDRLQYDVRGYSLKNLTSSIESSVSKGKAVSQDIKNLAAGVAPPKNSDDSDEDKGFGGINGNFSLGLTSDNIIVGADIEVNTGFDSDYFKLSKISLKLNTLDDEHEYWKIGGTFAFPKILPELDEIEGEISSYYWFPDNISVKCSLKDGIPVYKIVYIDKFGAKIAGLSAIAMKIDSAFTSGRVTSILCAGQQYNDVEKKDITLAGTVGASANVFKTLSLPVGHELEDFGEIGTIDGEFGINLTKKGVFAKADIDLLKQKVASAEINFGLSGLKISGKLQADVSGFGMGIGGDISELIEGTTGDAAMELDVNGKLNCDWTKTHWNGSCSARLEANTDCSYFGLILKHNNLISRFWYKNDSSVLFLNRFHAQTT